ncbi:uncharacterized protein LOC112589252 [Harpegnathos saltator]|uniref:uncharacterized protein LOC112589252 n=1 Tax=Harpegnathos saltator TaxID=610380 RepID=UPI000DBED7EC|nr:uncharacterized protein LOC112589252 [Harpegnathos saltator]
MERHNNLKVNTVFNGEFIADDNHVFKNINTRNSEHFSALDLEKWYEQRVIEPTLASLEEFQERDSGWALLRILDLTVNVNKYNPLYAGCNIELPREIKLKKAVINVRTKDNACFAWSVVAVLYPAERHGDRKSSYPHYTKIFNLQDIEFPMTIKQITKFKQLNNISINVIQDKKKQKEACTIVPIRLASKKEKHVNLLYVQDLREYKIGHFV